MFQLREIQQGLEDEILLCDAQQDYLNEIINELKVYIAALEKDNAKKARRIKILKTISYLSVGANAVLVLFLIVK